MDRRSFLRGLGSTAGLGALAGCSSPLRTRLDHQVDGDDGDTVVQFTGASGTVTMQYLLGGPHDGRRRFRASLSHDVAGVRSFRLRFKPQTAPGEVPPTVLLERPGGHPFPLYRFQQGDGQGWTLFEVPDLGTQAPGTFTVEFWFQNVDTTERFELTTDLHAELDGGLARTLVADAQTTVRGPASE